MTSAQPTSVTPTEEEFAANGTTRSGRQTHKPKKEAAKVEVLRPMYIMESQRYLIGNECVTTYTRELGFEYVYPFTEPGARRNDLYVFSTNQRTRLKMFFRHGPGWARRVRKRIEQCRISSGDFVG